MQNISSEIAIMLRRFNPITKSCRSFWSTHQCFSILFVMFCMLVYSFCRYVMDELGSALGHSDEPNFKVAPFLFMPSGNLDSAVRYKFSDFSSAHSC